MEGYLGEEDVSHEFDINPTQGALLFIWMYGGIDGAHHKDWLLDQVVRILSGAPIIVKRASWSNGHTELRYSVGESEAYDKWLERYNSDEDEFDWDQGIAP